MDLGLPAGLALAKPISLAGRGGKGAAFNGAKSIWWLADSWSGVGPFFGKTTLTELVCFASHRSEAGIQTYSLR